MKYILHGEIYDLTDEQISKSPYLSTLSSTQLMVEMDEDDNIILKLDVSPSTFQNYINYIRGKMFSLERQDEQDFFNFMGHDNLYEYPAEYWKYNLYHGNAIDMTVINDIEVPGITDVLHDIDIYYVGSLAMLSGGIISKPGHITILYHKRDSEKVINAVGNSLTFDVKLNVKMKRINHDVGYKVVRPLLEPDDIARRMNNIDKIWNDDDTLCYLMPLEFNSIEDILYMYPSDTDEIVLHKKNGNVLSFKATGKSYRSYVTKTVWFNPDKLSRSYIGRLCDLSLMGFKVKVPLYDEIVLLDDFKMRMLMEKSGMQLDLLNTSNYSSVLTFNMTKELNRKLHLSIEDYIALLTIGPTRFPFLMEMEPYKLRPEIDINELYTMTQLTDTDIFDYMYNKYELYDRELDELIEDFDKKPVYYKVSRIDPEQFDKSSKRYAFGSDIYHIFLGTTNPIPSLTFADKILVAKDIKDQIYCELSTGILCASLPFIWKHINVNS